MNNALQSSIRTRYVPSRIFWEYFGDIPKLYWGYIYCLPSNKYYNKNVLMSPYKHWMNLTYTPIKPLYIMQYCYDMHCHTWIRKTIRRENSFIINVITHSVWTIQNTVKLWSWMWTQTPVYTFFRISTLLKSYIIITALKYLIFINIYSMIKYIILK